jgi:acetyl-CoA carboxylase carboxyltransferase component
VSRLRALTDEYRQLAERLRAGGGPARVAKMHQQGKLAPRERVAKLLDPDGPWLELGLLVAYDQYDGQAPGAGVITGVGVVEGREVVVVANDATVKAGSWWPETIRKILRAQEIAMRQRIPIIYLVDSAGVNLPYQGGVFPGQYGAARIFYYNSIMRRYLHVPQISAVMGSCIAGGAYLPALSDVIFMVEGTTFMGLGHRADHRRGDPGRRRDAHRSERGGPLPRRERCRLPRADPRVRDPAATGPRRPAPPPSPQRAQPSGRVAL